MGLKDKLRSLTKRQAPATAKDPDDCHNLSGPGLQKATPAPVHSSESSAHGLGVQEVQESNNYVLTSSLLAKEDDDLINPLDLWEQALGLLKTSEPELVSWCSFRGVGSYCWFLESQEFDKLLVPVKSSSVVT